MADRKEEILKIATKLFYEGGYDNTSTRELAKAAGLSIAGLYYFFQNKEDILFHILNLSFAKLKEAVYSAIKEGDDPQLNITRIIENMVKVVVENSMELALLSLESKRLNPEQLQIIKTQQRELYRLLKNEFARLQKQGRLEDFNLNFITFALYGIVTYMHRWYDPNGPLSVEQIAAQTNRLFFR